MLIWFVLRWLQISRSNPWGHMYRWKSFFPPKNLINLLISWQNFSCTTRSTLSVQLVRHNYETLNLHPICKIPHISRYISALQLVHRFNMLPAEELCAQEEFTACLWATTSGLGKSKDRTWEIHELRLVVAIRLDKGIKHGLFATAKQFGLSVRFCNGCSIQVTHNPIMKIMNLQKGERCNYSGHRKLIRGIKFESLRII